MTRSQREDGTLRSSEGRIDLARDCFYSHLCPRLFKSLEQTREPIIANPLPASSQRLAYHLPEMIQSPLQADSMKPRHELLDIYLSDSLHQNPCREASARLGCWKSHCRLVAKREILCQRVAEIVRPVSWLMVHIEVHIGAQILQPSSGDALLQIAGGFFFP